MPALHISSKKIALDLDGTLIDAKERQVELAASFLSSLGKQLNKEQFWALKREGYSTRDTLTRMGYACAADIAARWRADIEKSEWLARDQWLPGAQTALSRLAFSQVHVRILTARGSHSGLLEQIKNLKLDNITSDIIATDPDRAAVEKAMHLEGHILFVGDTESDAKAAELAGIPFAAVATGLRSRSFLEQQQLWVEDSLQCVVQKLIDRNFNVQSILADESSIKPLVKI